MIFCIRVVYLRCMGIRMRRLWLAVALVVCLGQGTTVAFAWNAPSVTPPDNAATITTRDGDPTSVLDKFIGVGQMNPQTDPRERFQITAGSFLQDMPSDPKSIAYLGLIQNADGVGGAVVGNYAYYIAKDSASPYASHFRIIDVTRPSAPAVVGGSNLDGVLPVNITGISVRGRYAYLVFDTTNTGIATDVFRVVDIGNPANPQVMPTGTLSLGVGATDIAVAGPYAYITFRPVSSSFSAFVVVDVTNPANPVQRGILPSGSAFFDRIRRFLATGAGITPFTDVFVVGQYAYVAGETQFQVINIANPAGPIGLGGLTLTGIATDIFVSGGYAYVTTGNNLEIIDVTTSTPSRHVTFSLVPRPLQSVAVAGRYVYIGFYEVGADTNFLIVDIVDPSSPSPQLVAETAFTSSSQQIVLGGRHAYLFGHGGNPSEARFTIIDIPGIEAVSGKVGALTAGSLSVRDQAQIGGSLRVTQDLEVGGHALFNGNVEIGTAAAPRNLRIKGLLSKGGGSFMIDHPLDPLHKVLRHSFVESPDMKNIYDGIATLDAHGEAIVELPDYFEALNRDYRYQLSGVSAPMPNLYIKSEVAKNRFSIGGGAPFGEVSWQVTGTRKDSFAEERRIVVEEKKSAPGYLYPELYPVGQYGAQAK